MTHVDGVRLAKVVYDRYAGMKEKKQIEKSILNLLTEEQKASSFAVCLGLRFIYIFCGGNPKNLEKIKLKIKKNKLICKIKPEAKSLMDKEVERRLKNFANASNLNYEIIF